MPAMIGEDRLVPPMRYSEYRAPAGVADVAKNVCVWPTRYPVWGSPSPETSGTARPLTRPWAAKPESWTTPRWNDGSAKRRLTPPPDPFSHFAGFHPVPLHTLMTVPPP